MLVLEARSFHDLRTQSELFRVGSIASLAARRMR
jgi:hypothetical protein